MPKMKLSEEIQDRLQAAVALVTGEQSAGWLLTGAMALEATAQDIRREVEEEKIRQVVAAMPEKDGN